MESSSFKTNRKAKDEILETSLQASTQAFANQLILICSRSIHVEGPTSHQFYQGS